jgi:hypothetical protein
MGSTETVGRAHVDGELEAPREGLDGADVVEVAVRHEDGLRERSDLVEGGRHDVGLVARVDDERPAVAGQDEAVRAEWPEGQHEDVEMVGHLVFPHLRGNGTAYAIRRGRRPSSHGRARPRPRRTL